LLAYSSLTSTLSHFPLFYGNLLIFTLAAHCVNGRTPETLQVVLNEWKKEVGSEVLVPPIPRKIEAIYAHRSYSARLDYDIALLKLSEEVDLTGDVVPVCLPTDPTEDYVKKTATVSGWVVMITMNCVQPNQT